MSYRSIARGSYAFRGSFVRSAAASATVALALGLVGPAAYAQEMEGPAEAGAQAAVEHAQPSLIDASKKGSLKIKKRGLSEAKMLEAATGEEVANPPGDPLDGVMFSIYKINDIDLKTNEGLAKAKDLKASNFIKSFEADTNKVTHVADKKTANGGIADFTDLELGAYLVVETGPIAGYSDAAPFIAFIPMTVKNAEAGGTAWMYDVVAYPKNYKDQMPEKTVMDSGKNVGDRINYEIRAYPQYVREDETRTKFRVADWLLANLTAQEGDISVDGYTKGIDYALTVNGPAISIDFLDAGLKKLKYGTPVVVKINAKVAVLTKDAYNQASVIENFPSTQDELQPRYTPTVHTYFGNATFKKVAAKDENKGLQGAEFQVYGAMDGQQCEAAVKVKDQLQKANGKDKWASDKSGDVKIEGLHVNDFADNAEGKNLYTKYCLVETKSPKGYELLAKPFEFEIKKGDETQEVKINGGKIKNLEDTTPNLPLTGGTGVGFLAGLGALLVGVGAWLTRRQIKRG